MPDSTYINEILLIKTTAWINKSAIWIKMFYIYEDVILSTKNLEMIGKTAMQCNFMSCMCRLF